jgi:DNA-directed RNA polymerase specialized sigma24 family protein
LPLPQKQHVNPPIPLFKIPPAEWSAVLQSVAQGESLRQVARSYHTSYEAVRRVLQAARKELMMSESEQSILHKKDAEQ